MTILWRRRSGALACLADRLRVSYADDAGGGAAGSVGRQLRGLLLIRTG